MTSVEEHLGVLERKVDRYRRATVVLAVLLVAGVVMGQARDKEGEFWRISCEELYVRNQDGKLVASLRGMKTARELER